MVQTEKINRRDVIKAGGVVASTPFLSYAVGATESGFVELEANVTIPNNTQISVRIFEDTNGDGTANRQEEISLDDGLNTYVYEALDGFQGQAFEYWADIKLESYDGENTPVVDNMVINLPDDEPEDTGEVETWFDDFADGNINGWDVENGVINTSTESITGSYSLYGETHVDGGVGSERIIYWTNGPTLDLNETFEIEIISKCQYPGGEGRVRIGIEGDTQQEGENAYIIFATETNSTYLGTFDQASEPEDTSNIINNDFDNIWVNIKISISGEGNTLLAKVWPYGDEEPIDWQLEREFDGIQGQFSIDLGTQPDTQMRHINLDEIYIEGQPYVPDEHENLRVNARNFVVEGKNTPYEIKYNNPIEGWQDITQNPDSIESDNTNVIQVNKSENTFEGVGRGETFVIVNHEGLESGHQISCGDIVIGDIELLPPSRKIQAVLGDKTSQVIFASTFVGIFMSKLMTAYGNSKNTWITLGAAFSVILLSGFQGWISNGIVFSALFFVIISSILISNVRKNEVSVVQMDNQE